MNNKLSLLLLLPAMAFASGQETGEEIFLPGQSLSTADSATTSLSVAGERQVQGGKKFLRSSGEWLCAQLLPWAWNYEVRKAPFAHVTMESIGLNMKPAQWAWDDNTFQTNQFAHPYHGSLYFNAFRSNGYNFWHASMAAVAGSFFWETAGETHAPAPNDWINTSIGGTALGELTHRLASSIVRDNQSGVRRQVNEVLALLVNPMNGLTRILDGRWGRVHGSMNLRRDTMHTSLYFGTRFFHYQVQGTVQPCPSEWFLRMHLQYGNPFLDFGKPFDNFFLAGEINMRPLRLNNIQLNGCLAGKTLRSGKTSTHALAVSLQYDYIKNAVVQYGAQGINGRLLSRIQTGQGSYLLTEAGISAYLLAAVPDAYLFYGEGRNYDYGPGLGFAAGARMNFLRLGFAANYKGTWFSTVNGNPSHHYLGVFSADVRYLVSRKLSAGLQAGKFIQLSEYEMLNNIRKQATYWRISFGYVL